VAIVIGLLCGACATGRGSVLVRTADSSGATIPGVIVRLGTLTATGDGKGLARFDRVQVGTYILTGDMPGFRACPMKVTVRAEQETEPELTMRFGSIAMIGIVAKDGKDLVGSYCQQEFAACPNDPWSAIVVKPPGAEEIENLAK
jgi:hypothetical protein